MCNYWFFCRFSDKKRSRLVLRGLGGLKRDFCVLVGVHVINNSFKQLLGFLMGFQKFLGIFWDFDTLVTF